MKLEYTPEAIKDLREIKDYIGKNLHNPKAAARITKSILDACAALKQFPEMGTSVAAKTGFETSLRMLSCEKQIAFYCVDTDNDTISIARIINGRQDYIRLLFGEMTLTEEETLEEDAEQDFDLTGPTMFF